MPRASSWRQYRPGGSSAAQAVVSPRSVPHKARILGLDPGSRATGFGVIDVDSTGSVYVASGAVRAEGQDFAQRLHQIYAGVASVIATYQPTEVAIERVFVSANPDSALKLGQARGAAICATFASHAPVFEYSAREVKQGVVGSGAALKPQVQKMIRILLKVDGKLGSDAADALAVALCHAHGRATRHALARVGVGL
jgi:crossover junction endodeoxyribonuclease RuvC